MFKSFIYLSMTLLLINACTPEDTTSTTTNTNTPTNTNNAVDNIIQPLQLPTEADESFSYQTQRNVKISLVIKENKIFSQNQILIYENQKKIDKADMPGQLVTFDRLLTQGSNNSQGQYIKILTLGNHINSLWIIIPSLSYQEEVPIINNAINLTIKQSDLQTSLLPNFESYTDSAWNYHFDTYLGNGGILKSNKMHPGYTISPDILSSMITSLPEKEKVNIAHPEYFPTPEPEIIVSQSAELFVTFYSEGTGYNNSLGYYTYEGNTHRKRPMSFVDLQQQGTILFPNTSLIGSGGDMTPGTTVSLGTLSKGTKVMFFLITNGWRKQFAGIINSHNWMFSTLSDLNLDDTPDSNKAVPDHKHVALLWKELDPGNILMMGFEDILRTHSESDHDFNDVLFSVSTSPMHALKDTTEIHTGTSGFSEALKVTDSDGDGVNNSFDAYPYDAKRTYNQYYPSANTQATILFEDMWPIEGDYDMNDLAVSFSIKEVRNAKEEVKDIIVKGSVQAYGAGYSNGFSLSIDSKLSNISSAKMRINSANNYDISHQLKADKNSTIIKIFDDAQKFLNHFDNVHKAEAFVESDTFEISITLTTAMVLSAPPYNPFMVISKYQSSDDGTYNFMNNIEVHLPNFQPSSFTPTNLFGKDDDDTDFSTGKTYQTKDNKPWALLIPTNFAHPAERVDIQEAYMYFKTWATSRGKLKQDWYIHTKRTSDNLPYSDLSKIIVPPTEE